MCFRSWVNDIDIAFTDFTTAFCRLIRAFCYCRGRGCKLSQDVSRNCREKTLFSENITFIELNNGIIVKRFLETFVTSIVTIGDR